MKSRIEYVDLDKLTAFEIDFLRGLAEKEYDKLLTKLLKYHETELQDQFKININLINDNGKRKIYHLKAQVWTTAGHFEAEESDWDLTKSAHRLFRRLSNLIDNKFKFEYR